MWMETFRLTTRFSTIIGSYLAAVETRKPTFSFWPASQAIGSEIQAGAADVKRQSILLTLGAALVVFPVLAIGQNAAQTGQTNSAAQQDNTDTWSPELAANIVKQVRSRLTGLPDYSVFDSLHFAFKGKTIVLKGYASRPELKSEAGNVVKGIEGVNGVENQIQVLPPSPSDDRIRVSIYGRIYSQPTLRKYTSAPPGFGEAPSVARAAAGITADPPIGYHAIHIIVDNGNVILTGVVDSKTDADIAAIQANSTPGVFSVDNDLQIAGNETKTSK
jgi:hyperosmotically inducible protein